MARRPDRQGKTFGDVVDLFDYKRKPVPARRPAGRKKEWWPVVTDDWPQDIPIKDAELDIIEVHFADLLDELFGPRH